MDDELFLPFSLFRYSGSELLLTGVAETIPPARQYFQGSLEESLGGVQSLGLRRSRWMSAE
jgi:hypothetical protein